MTPSALPIPSVFAPVSTPAFLIRDLSWLMLAVCAAIFAVVAYLLVYALVRYRARGGEDDREPPQVYGSNSIEVAWIVVPLLIVVVLFLATARTVFEIERAAAAGPRPSGDGGRTPVVVGVSLPGPRHRHRQRAAHSRE